MPEPDHIKRAVEGSLRRLRIRQVMAERLEMLPLNKQIGFFLRRLLHRVDVREDTDGAQAVRLGPRPKVALGPYILDEAVEIAGATLFDTPRTLLKIKPRPSCA